MLFKKIHTREAGSQGEKTAADYLRKKGYRVLELNYRFHRYEVDIIARHGDTLVFVEVKARHSETFGQPEESVTLTKQRHIIQAAKSFLSAKRLGESCPVRFDVIAVNMDGSIRHIEGAFEASN
jgi:putative endonuclease